MAMKKHSSLLSKCAIGKLRDRYPSFINTLLRSALTIVLTIFVRTTPVINVIKLITAVSYDFS
jgi:hypothetical protein